MASEKIKDDLFDSDDEEEGTFERFQYQHTMYPAK